MKVVILAGGAGTRLAEETEARPKPMVEIGGRPILWHIMKLYSRHGFDEFVVCVGYKGELIKQYFADYHLRHSDVTFDLRGNRVTSHSNQNEPWKVTVVDTGAETLTGGRLKRVREHLAGEDVFLMTYGDGVADVDLGALVRFHRAHGRLATLTAVTPTDRFGVLTLEEDGRVSRFKEKQKYRDVHINGGFFALSPRVLDYVEGDSTAFEREPLERLAGEGQLMAFRHAGFWQCMDTLRDRKFLEGLWSTGRAPWKTWD